MPRDNSDEVALIEETKIVLVGTFDVVKNYQFSLTQLVLEMGLDLSEPARTDRLSTGTSYSDVYDVVKGAFEGQRMKLLEALGQNIIDALFNAFPTVDWVILRVRKPEAPIAMVRGEAAVELRRQRATK